MAAVLVDRRGCDWSRTSVAGSLPLPQPAGGGYLRMTVSTGTLVAICYNDVQQSRRHPLHGARIRCDFLWWLVLCRMEAALAGWCGGDRSRMPVTSPVPQRSPTSGGLLRFLATPSHSMARLGLGHGGCRAMALLGPWLWPTIVSSLASRPSLEALLLGPFTL